MTRECGKCVHAPWDHMFRHKHVDVWNGQRNVWSEWLCSALLCARGHSSCVLADDFSLTSIRRTVWVVHSRGSLFTSEDAEGGLMTVGQEGVLWPMHPHSKQMDDIPSY